MQAEKENRFQDPALPEPPKEVRRTRPRESPRHPLIRSLALLSRLAGAGVWR